jgi:hypothetical protein
VDRSGDDVCRRASVGLDCAVDAMRRGASSFVLLTKREILERDRPVSAADQSDRSEEHEQRHQHA